MAEDVGGRFENWKVSALRGFLLARDAPLCDQAKAVLIQNCYLAVSLGLQPKKSLDAQDICQRKQAGLEQSMKPMIGKSIDKSMTIDIN